MSTLKVNPVMYLISDPRIEMTKGKFGAQAGHATQLALELTEDDRLTHIWRWCGGHYAKVVLMAENLDLTAEYIRERGFSVAKVIDEGRTEFGNTLTTTFLGVQVLDKNRADVQAVFGQFKLYRDSPELDPKVIQLRIKLLDQKQQADRMLADMEKALEEGQRSPFTKLKERLSARTSRRDSRDS